MGKTSVAAAERVHATTAPAVAAAANSSAVNARVNDSPNTNVPTMDGGGDETRARSASTFAAASARAWAIFAFASALASSTFAFASARVSARAIFVAHSASLARALRLHLRRRGPHLRLRLGHRVRLDGRPLRRLDRRLGHRLGRGGDETPPREGGSLAPRAREFEPRRRRHRASLARRRERRARAPRVEHHLRGTTLAHGGDPRARTRERPRRTRRWRTTARSARRMPRSMRRCRKRLTRGARGVREERAVVPGLFLRLRGGGNGDGVRVSGRETRAHRGRRVGG